MKTKEYLKSRYVHKLMRENITLTLLLIGAVAIAATLITLSVIQGANFDKMDGRFYFWPIFWFVVTLIAAIASLFLVVGTIFRTTEEFNPLPSKSTVQYRIDREQIELERQLDQQKRFDQIDKASVLNPNKPSF